MPTNFILSERLGVQPLSGGVSTSISATSMPKADLHFANGIPSNEKVTTGFATDLHTVRLGLNYRLK